MDFSDFQYVALLRNHKASTPNSDVTMGGQTIPVDTLLWGDTQMKFLEKLWLNLERTVNKRGRTSKKCHHLQTAMTKKLFFLLKIGVTPSVAARVTPTLVTPLPSKRKAMPYFLHFYLCKI